MGGQGKKRRPPLISGVEHYQDIEEENAPAEDDYTGEEEREGEEEGEFPLRFPFPRFFEQ
jgi:hypothetical protein